jgi:small multidrug resistance pump
MSLQCQPTTAKGVWSWGLGTAGIALIGWLYYRQALPPAALAGLGLIIAGVVTLQLSGAMRQ